MASQTVQGLVLRFANYRDHDRMLTLLSPQFGKLDVLSRGCRRPKSPLLPASELFVHGEFVLFQSKDRYTLTSCTITDTFYPLRLDHYRLTCASYMISLCQVAAQQDEQAPELYALLLQGLFCLAYDTHEPPLSVTTAFLLSYAGILGYKPRMNHCAHCRAPLDTTQGAYIDVAAGGLVCSTCCTPASYLLRKNQVEWMHSVMQRSFQQNAKNIPKKQVVPFSESSQIKTDASDMFLILRRYVESRLETTIKVSKFLP